MTNSKKIKDGTFLYCDYLHLDSAKDDRDLSEKGKGCKEWKVESKRRPVLILYKTKEHFHCWFYVILQLTTQEKTAKKNGYFKVGQVFGEKISYARSSPETYPVNLLDVNGKTKTINPLTLSAITEKMSLSKIGFH